MPRLRTPIIRKACEIPDTATPEELTRKSELLYAHAKAVREHVKTLGDKALLERASTMLRILWTPSFPTNPRCRRLWKLT